MALTDYTGKPQSMVTADPTGFSGLTALQKQGNTPLPITKTPTPTPVAPTPVAPKKPISPVSSSAIPVITKGITSASTAGASSISTAPTPAPKAPAPLPTGYTLDTQDAQGNTTVKNANGMIVATVPKGGDASTLVKSISDVQSAVSKQFGSSYNVTSDSAGNILVSDDKGKQITSIGKDAAGDAGSISSSVNAIQVFQDTKESTASALDSQLGVYKAQLDSSLADIERQRQAAVAAGGAAAGSTSAVSTTTGGYIASINARFDQATQDALNAYNNAVNTARSNAQTVNTKAESDMQSALQGIEQTTQSNVLATEKFNQTIKQQATSNFMANLKNIDTGSLDANGRADLVKQGVAAGLSEEGANDFIDAQSLAQKRLDQSNLTATLAGYDLSKIANMTLEDAKNDKGLIGTAMAQATKVLGSDQSAFEAIQGSYKQAKNSLDLQKEQNSIAIANINASLAPERMQLREMTYGRQTVQTWIQDASKPNAWGTVLNNIAAQMPKIESAYQQGGKGVSALTMIDALIKIDTDGQAIRQGQTEFLSESGMWGDAWNRYKAKLGWSDDIGANTILTKSQVEQIYKLAKTTAAEKIKASNPGYAAFKANVPTLANEFPQGAADVTNTAQNYTATIDQFIAKYGTDVGVSPSTASTPVASGSTVSYQGKTYSVDASGNMTPL